MQLRDFPECGASYITEVLALIDFHSLGKLRMVDPRIIQGFCPVELVEWHGTRSSISHSNPIFLWNETEVSLNETRTCSLHFALVRPIQIVIYRAMSGRIQCI